MLHMLWHVRMAMQIRGFGIATGGLEFVWFSYPEINKLGPICSCTFFFKLMVVFYLILVVLLMRVVTGKTNINIYKI